MKGIFFQLKKLIFTILLIACLVFPTIKSMEELEGIIPIDSTNLNQVLRENSFIFIFFHKTQATEHLEVFTKHFKEFKKAYISLKLENLPVQFGIVDVANNPNVAEICGVTDFPNYKFYIDENALDYKLGPDAEDMAYFLKVKLQPPSVEFYLPEDLDNFVGTKEVVVFFGEPKKENPKYRQYLQIARNYDDVIFAHCGTVQCIEHYKINWNEIMFFKKHVKRTFDLHDPYTDYMVTRLVDDHYTKLISPFEMWAADFIFTRNNVGIFLFRDVEDPSSKKFEFMFKRISKFFKGYIHFLIVDMKNDYEKEVAKITKIKESDMPCIYLYDARLENILTYKYDLLSQGFSEEKLYNFIIDFGNKKLQPYYASEELVPEEKQTHPVRTIVGKTYKEEIWEDKENYIFIFMYGDDCKYCHKALKLFEHFAKMIKNKNKDLKIKFYKMNGDLNEVPSLEIPGYPYMKLLKPGDRFKGDDYPIEQNRSLKRLGEFLLRSIHEGQVNISDFTDKADDDFEIEYEILYDTDSKKEDL
jgi:thiol-disulfide isomerase/thioredoxin